MSWKKWAPGGQNWKFSKNNTCIIMSLRWSFCYNVHGIHLVCELSYSWGQADRQNSLLHSRPGQSVQAWRKLKLIYFEGSFLWFHLLIFSRLGLLPGLDSNWQFRLLVCMCKALAQVTDKMHPMYIIPKWLSEIHDDALAFSAVSQHPDPHKVNFFVSIGSKI